jgi:hypothetical protein
VRVFSGSCGVRVSKSINRAPATQCRPSLRERASGISSLRSIAFQHPILAARTAKGPSGAAHASPQVGGADAAEKRPYQAARSACRIPVFRKLRAPALPPSSALTMLGFVRANQPRCQVPIPRQFVIQSPFSYQVMQSKPRDPRWVRSYHFGDPRCQVAAVDATRRRPCKQAHSVCRPPVRAVESSARDSVSQRPSLKRSSHTAHRARSVPPRPNPSRRPRCEPNPIQDQRFKMDAPAAAPPRAKVASRRSEMSPPTPPALHPPKRQNCNQRPNCQRTTDN